MEDKVKEVRVRLSSIWAISLVFRNYRSNKTVSPSLRKTRLQTGKDPLRAEQKQR